MVPVIWLRLALIPQRLCQQTSFFLSWPRPGYGPGAWSGSFITTEPGALWERLVWPLSAPAAQMQACVCSLDMGLDHILQLPD